MKIIGGFLLAFLIFTLIWVLLQTPLRFLGIIIIISIIVVIVYTIKQKLSE